jgi:hypothetical protein
MLEAMARIAPSQQFNRYPSVGEWLEGPFFEL